jgi:spore coat protein U-like protein
MRKLLLMLIGLVFIVGLSGIALAGTDTDTLTVDGTIVASCEFTNAAQALHFGDLTIANLRDGILPAAGPTATVKIICTNTGTAAALYSADTREMDKSGTKLAYQIYLDSAGTNALGIDLGSGDEVTANGEEQTINLYGGLTGGQATKGSGAYTQDITLTVEF